MKVEHFGSKIMCIPENNRSALFRLKAGLDCLKIPRSNLQAPPVGRGCAGHFRKLAASWTSSS